MSWKTQGLYCWTTRKPHAILGLGLPVVAPAAIALAFLGWVVGQPGWWLAFLLVCFKGRHVAYFGHTSSRYHRDRQHRYGGGRYGAVPKMWGDLAPKVYPWPCAFPGSKLAREIQEWCWIKLLMPVYNEQHNTHNPRRIKPGKAEQLRWMRDANPWLKWGHRAVRFAFGCVVLAGAAYALLA